MPVCVGARAWVLVVGHARSCGSAVPGPVSSLLPFLAFIHPLVCVGCRRRATRPGEGRGRGAWWHTCSLHSWLLPDFLCPVLRAWWGGLGA